MRARRVGLALTIVVGVSLAAACTFGDLDGASDGKTTSALDGGARLPDGGFAPVSVVPDGSTTAPVDAAPVCVPEPVALPADAGDDQRFQLCGGATIATDVFHDSANCGWCGHDCRGLTCDVGRCVPAIVAEPLLTNQELGGASDGTHVYTLIDFNNNGLNSYGWVTHNIDGSDDGGAPSAAVPDSIASGQQVTKFIATGGTLYTAFDVQSGGHLLRAVAGSNSPATDLFPPPPFRTPQLTPSSIGLYGTTMIYGSQAANETSIGTLDLNDAGIGIFIQDRKQPDQVLVTPNQKIVAWVESPNGSPTDIYVFTDRPYLVATNPNNVQFLTADDDYLYFISEQQVERVPTSATTTVTPEVVYQGALLTYPTGLAVDSDHVFWVGSDTSGGASTIFARAKCAPPEFILADNVPSQPQHLFSSGTTLFYLTSDHRFFRVAK